GCAPAVRRRASDRAGDRARDRDGAHAAALDRRSGRSAHAGSLGPQPLPGGREAGGATRMTLRQPTAIFRCDAGADIGIGHLARSAALAAAFRDAGVRTVLMTHAATPATSAWLECFDAVAPAATSATVRGAARAASALVVDGYALVDEFFARAHDDPFLRVAIDDGPGRALACDAVIDPNLQRDDTP